MQEVKVITQLKSFQIETVSFMKKNKNGCLILNEAGLGKTLSVISYLIDHINLHPRSKTLIVCPSGLIDVWISEFEKHTNFPMDKISRYHGLKRKKEFSKSSKQKIFITSYNLVANDLHIENGLLKKRFTNVIFDEVHNIRNYRTKNSIACRNLDFTNAFLITATPIVNVAKDCFIYSNLLGHFDTSKDFSTEFPKTKHGLYKLNHWISKHGIRKTKEKNMPELPEKLERTQLVNLNEYEVDFYNALEDYSLKRIKEFLNKIKKVYNNQELEMKLRANVLVLILRLKQCCVSPYLIIESMRRLSSINTIQDATKMLEFYNQNKDVKEDCGICLDNDSNTIFQCGHKICGDCWKKLEKHKTFNGKCPVCRVSIESVSKVNETIKEPDLEKEVDVYDGFISSSKIKILIDTIEKRIQLGKKTIISSQWTSVLFKLEKYFDEKNIKIITLNGSVPISERTKQVIKFQTDSEFKICLLSLTSSAEGLTLTSADTFIHLDWWWNRAKMHQANCRIHRISQKVPVEIIYLKTKDTIEEQISKLIDKKSRIAESCLGSAIKIFGKNIDNYNDDWIKNVVKLLEKSVLENE